MRRLRSQFRDWYEEQRKVVEHERPGFLEQLPVLAPDALPTGTMGGRLRAGDDDSAEAIAFDTMRAHIAYVDKVRSRLRQEERQ